MEESAICLDQHLNKRIDPSRFETEGEGRGIGGERRHKIYHATGEILARASQV